MKESESEKRKKIRRLLDEKDIKSLVERWAEEPTLEEAIEKSNPQQSD